MVTLTLETEGKSVQQMVNEALQRVPNDNGQLKQHYRLMLVLCYLSISHSYLYLFLQVTDILMRYSLCMKYSTIQFLTKK